MIPRVASGAVLVVLALTSILYLPQTLFLLLLDLVLLLALREFFQMLAAYHARSQLDSSVATGSSRPQESSLSPGAAETHPDKISGSERLGWVCLLLGLLLTWIWVFQPSWVPPIFSWSFCLLWF